MSEFKPEGLILPDCPCFKKKAEAMNEQISQISGFHTLEALLLGSKMAICPEAREYFISIFIADILMLLLTKDNTGSDGDGSLGQFEQLFSDIYDRIKPMVMQRLHYADGKMMEAEEK